MPELVARQRRHAVRVDELCEVCHTNGLNDAEQQHRAGHGSEDFAPDGQLLRGCFFRLRFGQRAFVFRQFRFCVSHAAAGCDHILRRDGFGQDIAGDAVRSGRIEAVAREKRLWFGFGDDIAVEEQGAAVGVFRAELDVVADHQNRHAGRLQRP